MKEKGKKDFSQMGADVKRIRNGLCLTAAILMLSLPMQASAAGQDGVSMDQEGEWVSVALEMGNAQEEKISAVAVSLQIDEQSRDKVKAEFDFAGELNQASKGFFYNESTGVLDIYAASAESLFAEDILNLGYVRVTLKDSGEVWPVEISYLGSSFQSANEVYGEKKPMVSRIPDPVKMQVGQGTPGGKPEDGTGVGDGSGNGGNNGTEGGNGAGTGTGGMTGSNGSSGNDNMDQGLNDEKTQFVNDPSDAQLITSSIIGRGQPNTELMNMNQSMSASAGSGSSTNGSGSPQLSLPENKVSVVSPEKGPSSIHIAKGGSGSSGGTTEGEGQEGQNESSSGGTGGAAFVEAGAFGDEGAAGEEILLDQKEGGAVRESDGKKNRALMAAGIIAALAVGLGLAVFLLVKVKGILGSERTGFERTRPSKTRSARKKRRKKKRAQKKKSSQEKEPVRKKEADGKRKRPTRGRERK